MKRLSFTFLLAYIFLTAACSRLPEIKPAAGDLRYDLSKKCRAIFPQDKWQFTHAIEAAYPGGGEKLLMGVTVVDASRRTIDAVLMTVEGMVLLQARLDTTLHVQRVLPPFDREGFAAGLLADTRLIFMAPDAESVQTGAIKASAKTDAQPGCRYQGDDGMITDILPGTGNDWRIARYNQRGSLTRTVSARTAGGQVEFPGRMRLTAPGPAGYTLKLKLIDAVQVGD